VQPRDRFSANLKQARKRVGISQEELSRRCDVHRTEISLLERAGREPRLGTIVKLAAGLGVSVESLCVGVSWNVDSQQFRFKG
jgi:transcriptional regulator with XRE-family HTH domain